MKINILYPCVMLLSLAGATHLHAQLVPDGGLLNLTTTTNLASNLTVGMNNGARLNIIAPGAVTNFSAYVGYGISSDSGYVTVQNSGARWENTGNLYVGYAGDHSQVIVSNGAALSSAGDAHIGYLEHAVENAVEVTGMGSMWTHSGEITIGNLGNYNRLVVSNGAMVAGTKGTIGTSSSRNGVLVTGPDSVWTNSDRLTVGKDGGGGNDLVIANAGRVTASACFIGSESASDWNSLQVTDMGTLQVGPLYVGFLGGACRLTVDDGAEVTSGASYLGYSGTGRNKVLVSGMDASWAINGSLWVGDTSIGNELVVSNAAAVTAVSAYVGHGAGSDENTVVVTGTDSTWAHTTDLHVGYMGSYNRMAIRNGAVVANTDGYIGGSGSSLHNAVEVTGPGSLWTNSHWLTVGAAGSGHRLTVGHGGVVSADFSRLGGFSSADNTAVVTGPGSLWNSAGVFTIAGNGNNLVVSNGATLATVDGFFEGDANLAVVTGPGSVWANSDTLYVGSYANGNELIVSNGASVQADQVYVGFPTSGYSSNVLRLAGGEVKAPGGLTVNSDHILTGQGTLVGPVSIANGGKVVMEISKSGGTLANDQIQVDGALTYGGTLIVNKQGTDPLVVGDRFPLFSAAGYAGAFSGFDLPPLPLGLEWSPPQTDGTLAVQLPTEMKLINAKLISGRTFRFDVVGGPPNGGYTLLFTYDLDVPLENWNYVLRGTFDATGTESLGLTSFPHMTQVFYRVEAP